MAKRPLMSVATSGIHVARDPRPATPRVQKVAKEEAEAARRDVEAIKAKRNAA